MENEKIIDTSLFGRLTRIFGTDVVIRNVGGNQLKVSDHDAIQSYGNVKTNSLIDRFTKLHRYGGNAAINSNIALNYQTLRIQLYADYEAMDTETIIASALDILADECCLRDEMSGEILQIRSDDQNIQEILYNLFYDVLNIEFNLWPIARNMAKYGDAYYHLEVAEKFGVYKMTPLSPYDMVREEGMDPNDPQRITFRIDPNFIINGSGNYLNHRKDKDGKIVFENYEIAHFRLVTDSNYLPYGRSFIEPARKTYKQYVLVKDAMLLHRVTRAPERRIYYINVGSIPPNEVDSYMQKLMQRTKKTSMVDPNTGEYNLRYNMQNMMEDFYIPVRGTNDNTKIDTAKGLEYNAIEDVNFLRDEMLAGLKVPKAYFGFEKDLSGKATLASEDIRFARTVERIQRILLSELHKIALVHLYSQGYDGENLTNFELSLTVPSIVYEQEKVALWKEKITLAKDIQDSKLLPTSWIYDKIFKFSEDQYNEYRELIVEDQKTLFRLNQIEQEGNDPAKSGKSFGTPHDLASLYGAGRMGQSDSVPDGYNEKEPVGRPVEKASMINTQEDPMGRDRLGNAGMKPGNPLSEYHRNKAMLEGMGRKKITLFEQIEDSSLLDESTINDIED